MNSEELEQSLQAEFENYLKDVLADMKQEFSEFQKKMESEFDKHKSQLGEIIDDFTKKVGEEKTVDIGFKESVVEHLKLARDEGAKITAKAIAEAEEMNQASGSSADFSSIRNAINEISSENSQSEILKSLVLNASEYTPRGAFFIVKNEHLVGWRIFGTEDHPNPEIIREVYFPMSADTSLNEAVQNLGTVSSVFGAHEDDSLFLEKLGFGEPANMYSIPLVARGRGVAVLYADGGSDGNSVNVDAIETLMRVAGLTVEVQASAPAAKPVHEAAPAEAEDVSDESPEDFEKQDFEATDELEEYTPPEVDEDSFEQAEPVAVVAESDYQSAQQEVETDYSGDSWSQPYEAESPTQFDSTPEIGDSDIDVQVEPSQFDQMPEVDDSGFKSPAETVSFDQSPQVDTSDYDVDSAPIQYDETPHEDIEPIPESGFEAPVEEVYEEPAETESFEAPAEEVYEEPADTESFKPDAEFSEPAPADEDEFAAVDESPEESFDFDSVQQAPETSFEQPAEPVEAEAPAEVKTKEAAAAPVRSRFGDRNVDLPIEVEEGERRYHNDARRFARLLVSEIKLYNEQKVKEGRESQDLYERLREAIDRSREMYDKRVQNPVAEKFDYFNYELVNTLAEGDEGNLGKSYPGANI